MHVVLTRREALDVPDGINIFLFSLAEALMEQGHQVTVVSTAANDENKIREYFAPKYWPQIVALGQHKEIQYRKALTTWLKRGRKVLAALRPDFVVLNGAVPVKLPGLTCTVSHDLERRMDRYPMLRTLFKRWSYGRSDLIVATCNEVRDGLSRELDLEPDVISVIPTCVRLSTYSNQPLSERENAVLHMGTVDYKNPAASIMAFRHVATGDRKLYITGKVTRSLEQTLSALPQAVRQRIVLLGYVSSAELIRLLGSVKVVSVPSVYDAPVASPTVIEALASGTPVVASHSISKQVLEHDRNGFVCDPADNHQFARAYEQLLSDDDTWLRIATNARHSAERFCSHRIARMYVELAESALAGKRSSPVQRLLKEMA
ncbi:MAG: glycosyltransferase family 4 protein [Bryobacteraceae bacterium]|nr:glycosyltransferase family 4 protein [Bryobacteraceae bacterium]